MQTIAQSWLVYRLSDSAILLGLVGFANQIPVFLLAPFGGAFADRFNRHRVILVTQTTSMILAALLALLSLGGQIEIWHVFAISLCFGVVNAFDIPARQAFVVDMVGREDLGNAIALNSSVVNGARTIGPAIAGGVVAAVGEGWCFMLNALSYVAVIAGLLSMRLNKQRRVPVPGSALASIREGFTFVWKTKPIRALLLLLGLVSLMGMPYTVLMPVFAEEVLRGGAGSLGMLMAASGIGAMLAAVALALRKGLKGLGVWVLFSSIGFGISLISFALSKNFAFSVMLLIPVGFCMMVEMASSNTLIQSMVPDALRGRVMAVYSMMFMGMAPFGALLAGSLAAQIGAPATVALGGSVCILGGLGFAWRLPMLRQEARQIIVSLQMSGGDPPEEMTGESGVLVKLKAN